MATVGRVLASERYILSAVDWIARPIKVSYVGMRRLERDKPMMGDCSPGAIKQSCIANPECLWCESAFLLLP
jgi:hypothetical protein